MTRPLELILGCALLLTLSTGCSRPGADPAALMQSAQQSQAKGEHRAAIIELRNLLAIEPQNVEARRLLAQSHIANDEPGVAEDELRKALEYGIERRRVLTLLGRAQLSQGKHESLLQEIRFTPDMTAQEAVEIDVLRGLASLALGRADDAKTLLERANSADPDNAESLLGLAALAVGNSRSDEALQLIDRAVQAQPGSVEAWVVRGDFHRLHGKAAAAIEDYDRALALDPEHLDANVHLAGLYVEQERFEQAHAHIERVRARLPQSPFVTYLYALLEFRKKNTDAALQALEDSLHKHPDHLPSLLLAGTIHHAKGDDAKAIETLRAVLERAPASRAARRMLAAAMLRSGQVQRSIELLEQGLAEAPEDPELLAVLAQAHLANNEVARAIPLLERAARSDPKNAQARGRLQVARLLGGQSAAVLEDLESGTPGAPATPLSELLYVATLIQGRQFERALEALAPLEKQQQTPVWLNLKAAALVGAGKPDEARKALDDALALNPRFTTALINLARLDLQERGPHAARKLLETYLQRDPQNAQVLTALAQMGPELAAPPELVVEWLERARAANPRSVPQMLLLARAHLRSGDAGKALQVIEQAQRIDPEQAAVLEMLGEAQMALGQTSAALGTYSTLALRHPRSAAVLYRLARAQDAVGNAAGASLTLRRAIELEPAFAPALALLGALDLQIGRTERALAAAQELRRLHPGLPHGYALAGDVYSARKAFDQAAGAYAEAYARGDRSAELAIKTHMALRDAGRSQEAGRLLARFEKEHPAEVGVHAYLGDADLAAGRYAAAIERYQKVLEAQPQNALVLNNVAWAAHRLGDRRARDYAEKAYRLRPENPAILDTLGWLLVDAGQTKRGIELLQRAVTSLPDSTETRYHLAHALVKNGDFAAARRELESLLAGGTPFAQEAEARALLNKLR